MKKIALALIAFSLFACENSSTKGKRMLSPSSGNINNLSVVVDNELWDGNVGGSIRSIFGQEVYGLPQAEPLFSMQQMPTVVFTDFAKRSRTVLKIEKGDTLVADTKYYENAFAVPQKLVLVRGKTDIEIIEQLNNNSEKIIAAFKAEELKEKQKRISKSLHNNTTIQENLGATLRFPSAYRVAKEEEKFIWLRRDINAGTLNIMLYELPLDAISGDDNAIDDIIKIRDSIGKKYIPGPTEDTFMITEDAYTPFSQETILDNKSTIETKSIWEVEGAFMSGPFISYSIKDEINKRILVVEGFAYAPSVSKRNYVFELESIIKSIKIK